jgi:hypothetical protein
MAIFETTVCFIDDNSIAVRQYDGGQINSAEYMHS